MEPRNFKFNKEHTPGIFNPPFNSFYKEFDLTITHPNFQKKDISHVIGKNGRIFIFVTEYYNLDYIWYYNKCNSIGIWGNNEINIQNAFKYISNICDNFSTNNESIMLTCNEKSTDVFNFLGVNDQFEEKIKMYAIKYFSNILNDYVINEWYTDYEIAWKKYEESTQNELFIFKNNTNNSLRDDPQIINAMFPKNNKINYYPVPEATMVKMSECMVCNRCLHQQKNFGNELAVKEVCWDNHPLPIFIYCRYNKKCKDIVYNTLTKMAHENNILPINWILNNYILKDYIEKNMKFKYIDLFDKMYGTNYEKLLIPRSNGTLSEGRMLSSGEKCLFIKDNKLWIPVEFSHENKKKYSKRVEFKILLSNNKESVVLTILNNYFTIYSYNLNQIKQSLKPILY